MSTPDQIIDAALRSVSLPDGFALQDGLSLTSANAATRHYRGPNRFSIRLSVQKFESAETNSSNAEFESKKRVNSKSRSGLSLNKLALGDFSLIWQDRHTQWQSLVLRGRWRCQVAVSFKELFHSRKAKELAIQYLEALFAKMDQLAEDETKQISTIIKAKPHRSCNKQRSQMLRTPIAEMSKEDFVWLVEDMGSEELAETMTFSPMPASELAEYRHEFSSAGLETDLAPEIIASVMLSELRGLDERIFTQPFMKQLLSKMDEELLLKIFQGFLRDDHRVVLGKFVAFLATRFTVGLVLDRIRWLEDQLPEVIRPGESLRDRVISIFRNDVSIGWGQRQVDSIIKLGVNKRLPTLAKISDKKELEAEIRNQLLDPKQCIRIVACFIREMANQAASYSGPVDNVLMPWVARYACGYLDLVVFARPSAQWTPAHLMFLAWKYNTGHLESLNEISGIRGWGEMSLQSMTDIQESGIFDH